MWIRCLRAKYPVHPYRKLACCRHLGHSEVLLMAAVQVFFAKYRIKAHGHTDAHIRDGSAMNYLVQRGLADVEEFENLICRKESRRLLNAVCEALHLCRGRSGLLHYPFVFCLHFADGLISHLASDIPLAPYRTVRHGTPIRGLILNLPALCQAAVGSVVIRLTHVHTK